MTRVLQDPVERPRLIAALRALPGLSGRQKQLLDYAEKEQAEEERRAVGRNPWDKAPLAPAGPSWVQGFNGIVRSWWAAQDRTTGRVGQAVQVREMRHLQGQTLDPGKVWRITGKDTTTGRKVYGQVDATTGAGITLRGVEEWAAAADQAFRGRVVEGLDRYGAEWGYLAWRTWPVRTGYSRGQLQLRWAMKGEDRLVLQLVSWASYTLISRAVQEAFGRARGGMALVLQYVSQHISKKGAVP